jgi:hypothetical protein
MKTRFFSASVAALAVLAVIALLPDSARGG